MKTTLIFSLFLFGSLAWGSFKDCDSSRDRLTKYNDGAHPSHEFTASNRTLSIGGKGEEFPDSTDHLAIQRALIACGTGVLKCFHEKREKLPAKFTVSFQLHPKGQTASASDFNLTSLKNPELKNCLFAVWSGAQFGLILEKSVSISMPVEVK